jgi:serine/threonine-protein kinase
METQTRAQYRLETFGGLAVTGGAAPLVGAATQRRTLAILAVLASAGAQGITREKLLGLFWPDSDTARARHALKQALYTLRRDLRDDELVAGTATLRLEPGSMTSDVQAFEEALARGEPERAVELYRGPFLDGIYLDGAPEFERWLERERGRLAHAHAAALERLAAAAGAAGDHARATGWWRRLAAVDPLSSRVAVELMRALAAAGDPEAALRHARVHAALVWQELETPPDPAVAELAERIREELRARREQGTGTEPLPPAAAAPPPIAAPDQPDGAAELRAPSPRASDDLDDGAPSPDADGGVPQHPLAAPRRDRRRMRRRVGAALAFAVVAGAAAFAIARIDVARVDLARRSPPASTERRSVAVLPFVNMSADSANAYFSDGLSEELITALSRIDGLRVAARTSSFALRDARLDVRTIGDTLGVTAVVEGSVRREGNTLRVTAQLIDAESGYHLWAAEYDREMKDVFAVQDEIAGAIAAALEVELADRRGASPGAVRTTSLEAYDLYLRGTFFRNRLTREALTKAIEYFDRAIALDSGYALAWAGKASALGPLLYFGHLSREEGLPPMRAAARRALELDPGLGEAHAAAGIVSFFYDWDWPAAERALRRATELSPGDPHGFHHLANYLRAMRRFDEAIAARSRALELDPLNARTAITLAGDYVAAGRYDLAIEQYRHALDLDPENPLLLGLGPHVPAGLGAVHEWQGRYAAAVEEYVKVAARRGAPPGELVELRRAYAAGGMRGFWRRWLAFEERYSSGALNTLRVAAIWARIGDADRAAEWLERAYRERNPGLVHFDAVPDFDGVRTHPRVAAMVARMGLGARVSGER